MISEELKLDCQIFVNQFHFCKQNNNRKLSIEFFLENKINDMKH